MFGQRALRKYVRKCSAHLPRRLGEAFLLHDTALCRNTVVNFECLHLHYCGRPLGVQEHLSVCLCWTVILKCLRGETATEVPCRKNTLDVTYNFVLRILRLAVRSILHCGLL